MMKTKFDDLKEMVEPYVKNQPYYRPFICNGNPTTADIFIVGINPATPIDENDIEIDEYVNLLMKYDNFYDFYQKVREKKGKTKISRTRMGILGFVNELKRSTGLDILETNVIPFPTENIKKLKEIPNHVIEHAKGIFYKTLIDFTPKVIIVHSKTSLKCLVEMLAENKLVRLDEINLKQSINSIENDAPFIKFSYPNGMKGAIFACRHLMFYGNNGKSFRGFRGNLINYLNRN